jgi:DNA (cytosine-5)-methyltransferase 1
MHAHVEFGMVQESSRVGAWPGGENWSASHDGRQDSQLSSVELFVGAGGLALGLHGAGFLPILAIDSDARACETLAANTNHRSHYTAGWNIQRGDVHQLDYSDVPTPDLLAAGAPCQPFSIAGQLRIDSDERNLFPEVLRAIRSLRPRAFILENVRGLLSPRARPYFDYLIAQLRVPTRQPRTFESASEHFLALQSIPETHHEYRVEHRVLNAADFGLPQLRHRLFIVGVGMSEPDWVWPEETHSKAALENALWNDTYWDEHEVPKHVRESVRARVKRPDKECTPGERWRTLRDVTQRFGTPYTESDGDPSHVYVPGARQY